MPESCFAVLLMSSVAVLEPKLKAARTSLAAAYVSADLSVCASSLVANPRVAHCTLELSPVQQATDSVDE